ncbi:hypothetical protein ACFL7M_03235 [Thermodesulfobacteriota bacterium]
MTPLSFEWQWNIEYFIFMGLLYLALAIIGAGLIYTYIKTWFDLDDQAKLPPKIASRSRYTDY